MFETVAISKETSDGITTEFLVDYDKEKGVFRISFFEDYHFVDEAFFDKEVFEV